MEEELKPKSTIKKYVLWLALIVALAVLAVLYFFRDDSRRIDTSLVKNTEQVKSAEQQGVPFPPQLDFVAYDNKSLEIANIPSTSPSSTLIGWPVKTAYPNYGALLPFNRIVAYYGNLYSRYMGILGEYSEDEVLRRLQVEADKWEAADPSTPVVPALHYIAVVAQAGAGRDGKYRARMPDKEIDKVLEMAKKIDGIVFLDIQVGKSNVEIEVPLLEKYLRLPNVHLGIDPEFSMKSGAAPGTAIGTLDAKDINFAAEYLSKIVKENNLPPKVLVIHRFTKPMVTNYKNITPLPEAQIVMNMDGFGGQANKLNTYKQYIYKEPVQFAGFKLFYKNDTAGGRKLLAPQDLLKLTPIPVYIQYQ